jgi:hypothetical protein
MRSISMILSLVSLLALGGCAAVPDELKDPDVFVDVVLSEYQITLDRTIVVLEGNDVEFDISNVGVETHDFMVVRTGLAGADLPTNPDGTYMENGPGTEVVDAESEIHPGATMVDVNVNLPPGHYVVLCTEHYTVGMFADIDSTTAAVP